MACEETPEMIEHSLKLLAMDLQKLPSDYRRIYQKACSMPCKSKLRRSGNSRNGSGSRSWTEDVDSRTKLTPAMAAFFRTTMNDTSPTTKATTPMTKATKIRLTPTVHYKRHPVKYLQNQKHKHHMATTKTQEENAAKN